MLVSSEFTGREQKYPIILLIVHVCLKVLLHDRIHSFGLAICLGVVRGGQVGLDLQKLAECLPEVGDELRSTV